MTTNPETTSTHRSEAQAQHGKAAEAPPGRATFLLTTAYSSGHRLRVLDIAEALSSRGHRVILHAKPSVEAEARAAAAEFLAYGEYIDTSDRLSLLFHSERPAWMPKIPYAIANMRMMLGANGVQLARELGPVIQREKVDCVLYDFWEFGAGWAAERAGIPWASAGNMGTVLTKDELPLMFSQLPKMRPFTRVPALMHAGFNRALPLRAARAKLGLAPYGGRTADFIQAMASPHLHIIMAPRGFAGDIPLRDRQLFVGPTTFNVSAKDSPESPRIAPGSVIVSTTTTPNDGGLFRRVLEAVAPMNVPVLATSAGADEIPKGLGDHIRIERYVAHDTVFPEARALVTHGGWGTVGRALVHGLPMLVIPLIGDQLLNAALVERSGLGRHLPLDKATPEAIRAELTALLADNAIRDRIQRVSAEIKQLKTERAAARALERLAFANRRGAEAGAPSPSAA